MASAQTSTQPSGSSVPHSVGSVSPQPRGKGTVSIRLPHPLWLGLIATCILAYASYSGGSTRNRGGVLEALGIGFLSFGHGRNIGMLAFWVGMFLLVAAWIIAGRTVVANHMVSQASDSLATLRKWLWVWLAPLVVAGPLASRDVYSYLMQGAMVRDGFDPYTEGAAVNPGPYLLEVSHDWRNTTTPYGPLHLWMGEGVTSLVGSNVSLGVFVYKLISVAGFAVIVWAVPKIAEKLGANPVLALWLGVANPVMVLHLIGGMHNESVMVALVSAGLVLALNRHYLAGIALIAVAVALKATAFIAMPFVVWMMVHRFAGEGGAAKRIGAFVLSGAVMVIETVIVVAAITWASGSSWGWLSEITGNSKVINPLAGPTLAADVITPFIQFFNPDTTYNTILAMFRTVSMVIMLIGMVLAWWFFRHDNRHAIMGTAVAYQVAFIFNSVTLPWYYASVITLIAACRPPWWATKLAAAASIVVAVSFSGDGNHQLYNWWWVLATTLGAWALVGWIFAPLDAQRRKSHQSPATIRSSRFFGRSAELREP